MYKDSQWQKIAGMMEKEGINRRRFLRMIAATGLFSMVAGEKASAFSSSAKGRIVIIGGGAAGLSMAARLGKWLDDPDITLIDPSDRQYYQPGFTLIASGVYQPDDVWKKQEKCIPAHTKWVKDSVAAVDPVKQVVTTTKNGDVDYDFLVLTPGLQINWNEVEGFSYDRLGEGNIHCIYDFEGAKKTWEAMQAFAQKGGQGIYMDTYTKHKCGGAPKKICLLTDDYARKHKSRDGLTMNFYTASSQLYDVPYFTPRLEEIFAERDVPVHTRVKLKGVDPVMKRAYMEKTAVKGEEKIVTSFTESFDFLHFTPPMSAPDFVREAGLGWAEGDLAREAWVMVDKETLIHKTYPNIISLGDVAGIPTSKTSAAVRVQVPVAAKNLISLMEGKEPVERYDGYAACPIVTDYGHVLLCEFDYNKEPKTSFPFTLLDTSKEQWLAWLLKVYILKPLYFQGMLKGRA